MDNPLLSWRHASAKEKALDCASRAIAGFEAWAPVRRQGLSPRLQRWCATDQVCASVPISFFDRSVGLDVVVLSHLFPHLNFGGNQLGKLFWFAGQCDDRLACQGFLDFRHGHDAHDLFIQTLDDGCWCSCRGQQTVPKRGFHVHAQFLKGWNARVIFSAFGGGHSQRFDSPALQECGCRPHVSHHHGDVPSDHRRNALSGAFVGEVSEARTCLAFE